MIKVLSLFDGISGARQALKELNIDCAYYASEIDKFAIQVSKNNYPDIVQIGNVKGIIIEDDYIFYNQDNDPMQNGGSFKSDVDLLIGGSPCTDLSISKRNRQSLNGSQSNLFFDYVRILKQVKPRFFILENVASMSNDAKNEITKNLFEVEPILINSSLLTAQHRKRLYWCGALQEDGSYKKIEISQPEDKGILLKDILEDGDTEKLKSYCITATYSRACPKDYFEHGQRQLVFKKPVKVGHFNKGGQGDRVYSSDGKSVCLSANGGGRGACTGLYLIQENNGGCGGKELTNKITELAYNETNFMYMNSFKAYRTGKSYNIPSDVINELVSSYENGASTEELADICEVNVKTIYKILKEAGVVLQPNRYRKYKFNEHYFDKIDTTEKAYWLGFLFADGSVANDRNRISVALAEKDKLHIEKFAKALEIETPITYNAKTKSNRLVINSRILKEALVKLGCVPNKSFCNVEVPLINTPELCKAFIRGYFDGDGCLTCNEKSNRYKISFLGSHNLLMFINEFFVLMLGLSLQNLMQDNRRKTDNTFIIEYSGKQNVLNILNYLYDGGICLERKYNHYLGITNDDIRNRRKTGLYEIKGCAIRGRYKDDSKETQQTLEIREDEKTNCLTSVSKDSLVQIKDMVRKLTPTECARLQGYPDFYHNGISNSQAYKCYGNSFTVPVIKHILQHLFLEV